MSPAQGLDDALLYLFIGFKTIEYWLGTKVYQAPRECPHHRLTFLYFLNSNKACSSQIRFRSKSHDLSEFNSFPSFRE